MERQLLSFGSFWSSKYTYGDGTVYRCVVDGRRCVIGVKVDIFGSGIDVLVDAGHDHFFFSTVDSDSFYGRLGGITFLIINHISRYIKEIQTVLR